VYYAETLKPCRGGCFKVLLAVFLALKLLGSKVFLDTKGQTSPHFSLGNTLFLKTVNPHNLQPLARGLRGFCMPRDIPTGLFNYAEQYGCFKIFIGCAWEIVG